MMPTHATSVNSGPKSNKPEKKAHDRPRKRTQKGRYGRPADRSVGIDDQPRTGVDRDRPDDQVDEQDDQRAGGLAVALADIAVLEVDAQQQLADREQGGGDQGSDPDVLPRNLDIGQELEDRGEEQREDAQ